MKGDFTRDTFDARNQYSRVLMQQGRVQLDADWNERDDIVNHYLRALARDLIGPHGGPTDCLGFEITRDVPEHAKIELSDGDFAIGPGRYYVGGILVENRRWVRYSAQFIVCHRSTAASSRARAFSRTSTFGNGTSLTSKTNVFGKSRWAVPTPPREPRSSGM